MTNRFKGLDLIECLKTYGQKFIQSAKTRPGADCGSDHELCIAKFRLKLKKIGKTTVPFGYDQNYHSVGVNDSRVNLV